MEISDVSTFKSLLERCKVRTDSRIGAASATQMDARTAKRAVHEVKRIADRVQVGHDTEECQDSKEMEGSDDVRGNM